MNTKMLSTLATAVAIAAAPTLITSAPAGATATGFDAVGGREKVKITVHADGGGDTGCALYLRDGGIQHPRFDVPANSSRSYVYPVKETGQVWIQVYCDRRVDGKNVEIQPANPLLDAVDTALAGVGSSALMTDPALR
ncbi:hypothetical protein IU438_26535 [Nocardia cyriacigeorgica]|uniref:hypothetical protein n=1 Tax=Nocardia cyriacigeorgica TaxID=135487 RepID=UPI0018962C16|nr:hypothetical protein [Nocardia cyriacigeorgica]MBF6090143.1 hypothetical protein [Nocardia cyriacigeorgica]MBF6094666.1 hypothetical protein [Nocardia cyriacigeorgica]MBF6399338.1 hypothetical protein [Nocardia cyriacigeorgica]MBF6404968.1 hypothetical protein [Nocardia cyriacigeorgica]